MHLVKCVNGIAQTSTEYMGADSLFCQLHYLLPANCNCHYLSTELGPLIKFHTPEFLTTKLIAHSMNPPPPPAVALENW